MLTKYNNLYLTILIKEGDRRKKMGYRYLITMPSLSHTAFRTKTGLKRWLRDTGLTLGTRANGLYNTIPLVGSYKDVMTMDDKLFLRLEKTAQWRISKTLSNGEYTKALVKNGVIVYLNPNCKREVLPYVYE